MKSIALFYFWLESGGGLGEVLQMKPLAYFEMICAELLQ